jgi:hypothetical protein
VNTSEVLQRAARHLTGLRGHVFDLLTITKPVSPAAAVNLAKVVSKLSPLLGNLIEFNTVEVLNSQTEFEGYGEWERQDPGFPDTVFRGRVTPLPGIEIKAWFPLATEITARFRDSQNHFLLDNISVALLAWLPEHLIYGTPYIVAVTVVSGLSVAKARDDHYHNPPDYLVLEPRDTKTRTRNLQQTNTAGYKWQDSERELASAERIVLSWGPGGRNYLSTADYQEKLRQLTSRYSYRLDTNFAKIDRIVHPAIEEFKSTVLGTRVHGQTVQQWASLFCSEDKSAIARTLEGRLDIKEVRADELIE